MFGSLFVYLHIHVNWISINCVEEAAAEVTVGSTPEIKKILVFLSDNLAIQMWFFELMWDISVIFSWTVSPVNLNYVASSRDIHRLMETSPWGLVSAQRYKIPWNLEMQIEGDVLDVALLHEFTFWACIALVLIKYRLTSARGVTCEVERLPLTSCSSKSTWTGQTF